MSPWKSCLPLASVIARSWGMLASSLSTVIVNAVFAGAVSDVGVQAMFWALRLSAAPAALPLAEALPLAGALGPADALALALADPPALPEGDPDGAEVVGDGGANVQPLDAVLVHAARARTTAAAGRIRRPREERKGRIWNLMHPVGEPAAKLRGLRATGDRNELVSPTTLAGRSGSRDGGRAAAGGGRADGGRLVLQ